MPNSSDNKRDSGQPGGGAGRRDEVGHSGVYPMSGPRPEDPNAPIRDQASWGQGDRGAEGYNDSGSSEIFYMPGELPEEAVGQGNKQKDATGQRQPQADRKQPGRQADPNREPGGNTLYNEDKQGGVFYDKNTEIKRESEFHDSTGAPIVDEKEKVKPENDQFGKKSG